jgi:hypothetical protein
MVDQFEKLALARSLTGVLLNQGNCLRNVYCEREKKLFEKEARFAPCRLSGPLFAFPKPEIMISIACMYWIEAFERDR